MRFEANQIMTLGVRRDMKILLLAGMVALLAISLQSCSEDKYDHPVGFEGIIEQNSSTQLSSIIFTLDLTVDDSMYLLADSLFKVEVYLNNKKWGSFTSTFIDTTAFTSTLHNNNLITSQPVEYLFVTNDQSTLDTLRTAGEFSKALRDIYALSPGDFVAEIRYVSWVDRNGQVRTHAIRDLIPFKLEKDTETLYLGSFKGNVRL